MKTLMLIVLLLMAAPAIALDRCMTGSWYDPDVQHEGLVVEVLPEVTVAYWYTFQFFDALAQNWLVFQGPPHALAAYDVLPYAGGSDLYEVGVGELLALDENTLLFAFDMDLNLDITTPDTVTPWCLHVGCAGVYTLTRLTQPIICE